MYKIVFCMKAIKNIYLTLTIPENKWNLPTDSFFFHLFLYRYFPLNPSENVFMEAFLWGMILLK